MGKGGEGRGCEVTRFELSFGIFHERRRELCVNGDESCERIWSCAFNEYGNILAYVRYTSKNHTL